jgi:hypothetical protein
MRSIARIAIVVVTLLLTLAPALVAAQERLPRFSDYPAKQIYRGKVARPVFTTRAQREYRTRLRDAVSTDDRPNFAGRYYVAIWGCGSACISSGIIDARTGAVSMVPFTISGWREIHDDFEGVTFRQYSRLIVFSGERNEKGDIGQHFYVVENNGRLRHVKSVPQPDGNFLKPVED